MSLELLAIGSLAAVAGVTHVILKTPIFDSHGPEGDLSGTLNGDLAAPDQAPAEPSEHEDEAKSER